MHTKILCLNFTIVKVSCFRDENIGNRASKFSHDVLISACWLYRIVGFIRIWRERTPQLPLDVHFLWCWDWTQGLPYAGQVLHQWVSPAVPLSWFWSIMIFMLENVSACHWLLFPLVLSWLLLATPAGQLCRGIRARLSPSTVCCLTVPSDEWSWSLCGSDDNNRQGQRSLREAIHFLGWLVCLLLISGPAGHVWSQITVYQEHPQSGMLGDDGLYYQGEC